MRRMRITRLQRAGLLPAASLSAALALASTVIPRVAEAQFASATRAPATNGDGMDSHLFRPAIDSKGFFSVNGSDILGAGNVSFGLVLDYGHALMRTRSSKVPQGTSTDADGTVNPPADCVDENCAGVTGEGAGVKALVQNSFQGTFGFNYGVANMAVVGLSIPVNLMTGDVAYNIGRNDTGLYNSAKLDSQKLSFLALHGKLRLTRVDRGIGLAIVAQAGIPLSSAPRDLGADPKFWYWPQFVIENQFGAERRFHVGLNVGFRGHAGKNPRFENDTTGQPQLKEGTFEYSNLGTYNLGLSYRVLDALDLVAESYGTYQLGGKSDSKQKFSNEFLGGIKLFIESNSYLMMGAGSRAFSTGFEAADVRMVLGFVYEPSIGDRDGDGYKDDQDQCPDEPEDFDGYKDEDGCPEIDRDGDRDGDGIPDRKDKCPDDPEDKDGFEDLDGCPE